MLRGRFAEAVERFTQGLALWRGSAYADVEHDGRVALEALRLEALRIAATEDLLEARIGSGDHAGATAALEELVGAHPERERDGRSL
jgi:hypothetical protein